MVLFFHALRMTAKGQRTIQETENQTARRHASDLTIMGKIKVLFNYHFVDMYTCISTCACMHMCAHAHTHTHTHTHTLVHAQATQA